MPKPLTSCETKLIAETITNIVSNAAPILHSNNFSATVLVNGTDPGQLNDLMPTQETAGIGTALQGAITEG